MHPITTLMYFLSFLSLYLSIFWLSLLYTEEKKLKDKPKATNYFPKISVVVPAHNQENIIGKVLRSILKLDYPKNKLEVIAVNDGSIDGTKEILDKLKKKYEK